MLVAFLIACGSTGGTAPQGGNAPEGGSEAFSAVAGSPVSVDLAWQVVDGATGYLLEGKYGDGEFFQVAELISTETSYTHLVVPGSAQLSYRLSAAAAGGNSEIATTSVNLPTLAPNPIVVPNFVPFAPIVGEMPFDFSQLPTLDPQNPDPNVMATMAAMMANIDPNNPEALIPEVTPVSVSQEIGPEGGTILLTDPNGVVYSLEIPAGLVAESTSFTLDPIESIDGLPFSRLLAGIDIFPPIPFDAPLALTISLPESASFNDETVVAFIVSSLNHELSMTPIYTDGNEWGVNVYWGDMVGIATATSAEVLAQASRIPSDSAEQISQQIAVMQAISGDFSPEGVVPIYLQLLKGLLQQSEIGFKQNGVVGRLAAPPMQSRTGIELWNEISRAARLSSDVQAPHRPQDANLATELGNPAGRGQIIANLVSKIKQFLDTHTGCRTRDELYAQAILDLLYSATQGFELELAENFISRFGLPGELINCTFQLHIPQSTIVVKVQTGGGNAATETTKVHVDPMPLFVSGRGTDIHLYSLEGYGQVVYESFEFLVTDCPPAIRPKAPSNSAIYITDLSPTFDAELKVNGFKLRGIKTDLGGTSPSLGSVRTESIAGSCKVIGFNATAEAPNKWGIAMAGLHGPYGGSDNWVVVGEDSYVATNDVINFSRGGITENSKMILTVNKEGDGGTQ